MLITMQLQAPLQSFKARFNKFSMHFKKKKKWTEKAHLKF